MKNIIRSGLKKLLPGNDPDFLIIGAQKSGTTSLHYYLSQHPDLVGSKPKEVHYFERFINYPNRDIHWYRNRFKTFRRKNKLFFEATPSYIYHEEAAIRIKKFYPDIKLILLLRNPVDRAFSSWNMYRDYFEKGEAEKKLRYGKFPGVEHEIYTHLYKGRDCFLSFREAIDLEFKLLKEGGSMEPAIVRRGLYLNQINTYLKYFDRSQLLVIGFKDLVKSPVNICNQVLEFVGAERKMKNLEQEIKNKRSYGATFEDADRSVLQEFYKEPNQQLFQFLGKELDW